MARAIHRSRPMKTTKKKQNPIAARDVAADPTSPPPLRIEVRQQPIPLLDPHNADFPGKTNSGSLIFAKLLTLPSGTVARTVKVMPGQKIDWRSNGPFAIIYQLTGSGSPFEGFEGDNVGPNLRRFQSSAEADPKEGTSHWIRKVLKAAVGGELSRATQPYMLQIRQVSDTSAEDELVISATLQY